MSKFKKRITKMSGKGGDALVIGSAFGCLHELFDMYNTVFVHDRIHPEIKERNLVFKSEIRSIVQLSTVKTVFIDLEWINTFNLITPILTRSRPVLIVQGNDVVPKTETGNLYRNGYRAVAQGGLFHIWKKTE